MLILNFCHSGLFRKFIISTSVSSDFMMLYKCCYYYYYYYYYYKIFENGAPDHLPQHALQTCTLTGRPVIVRSFSLGV